MTKENVEFVGLAIFTVLKRTDLDSAERAHLEGLYQVNQAFLQKGQRLVQAPPIQTEVVSTVSGDWNETVEQFNRRIKNNELSPLTFGAMLADFRKRLNITQKTLAQSVGMSMFYLNKIETGKRVPPRRGLALEMIFQLQLTSMEAVELFYKAGYSPTILSRLSINPEGKMVSPDSHPANPEDK